MALKPVTVTQLNEYISRVIGTDPLLSNISVAGEISNLKFHSSGHVYFSMIDQNSKVNCFLPASYFRNLAYTIGDGLNVTVRGYINVYKKGGAYTLFVKELEVSGAGDLSVAFDLLKRKLQEEGLFDTSHKKAIPAFPKKIGILTSKTGAAVRDMIKIIQSRTRMTDVIVFPVPVQGKGAAGQMAYMLDYVNDNFYDIDTIILGRGGGSTEDLWPFNEEVLARAIYRSRIPVISAVGHEIDFSISDFVADLRAETPTAAAEKAVPDDRQLMKALDADKAALLTSLKNRAAYFDMACENRMMDIRSALTRRIERYENIIRQALIALEENNPSKVMTKGYTVIEDLSGKIITSSSEISDGFRYRIYFKDGTIEATVSDLKEGGKIDF